MMDGCEPLVSVDVRGLRCAISELQSGWLIGGGGGVGGGGSDWLRLSSWLPRLLM